MGDRPQAIADFETAGEIGQRLHFYRMVADSMVDLADIYRAQGDLADAESRLRIGLKASQQVGDRYYLPRNLTALPEVETRLGKFREADQLYDQAEDVINGILIDAAGWYSQGLLAGEMSETYLGHFQLAAMQDDVNRALEIIENIRGRILADRLLNHSKTEFREASFKGPQDGTINRLQYRLLETETPAARKRILEELTEDEFRRSYDGPTGPPNLGLLLGKPVTLADVERILKPDETVLEYVLAEPHSYCFVISRAAARLVKLPAGRRVIESLATRYRDEIKADKSDPAASQQLYSILLAPLAPTLSSSNLIIIPDGKLNLLPFEALRGPDGLYLVLKATVSYAPSATLLVALRRDAHPAAPREFLGLGGVQYSDRPILLADAGGLDALGGMVVRGIFDLEGSDLRNLPDARLEVQDAERQMGGPQSSLLLGDEATKTDFEKQPLGDFKIIHLAVHSTTSPEDSDSAALVLGRDSARKDSGILDAHDIVRFRLHADLVTLSACDTGPGRLEGEEGVHGLSEAFLIAGARSVVASLWQAEDTSTLALMQRFYSHLHQGESEAAALRSAKVDLLKENGIDANPFFWAGFVLQGDGGSPISQ
jgi:CHAT domain-containing protein